MGILCMQSLACYVQVYATIILGILLLQDLLTYMKAELLHYPTFHQENQVAKIHGKFCHFCLEGVSL